MAKRRKTPRVGDLPSVIQSARPEELPSAVREVTTQPAELQSIDDTIVTRTDRYGRQVRVYATGSRAGTLVGTDNVLYEPPIEEEAVPARTVGSTIPTGGTGTVGEENDAGTDGDVGKKNVPDAPRFIASDGTVFTDEKSYQEYQDYLTGKRAARQSAFDLLYEQFSSYGLGSLVEPLRGLIKDPSVSSSEFTIRLRQSDPYKKRFAANQKRIDRGLAAISEAEYLSLEDQYQNIMRNYGLPESFYRKDTLGTQKGFEDLIGFDVSAAELEDRVQQAAIRVTNAAPEVKRALTEFYPGITEGDILGYVLNPENALTEIRRKITAAEIGAGAMQAGLRTTAGRAEELARFGITAEEARRGFQTVAEVAPRGTQLAEFYGETPYTQQTAETEVFGTTGAVEAKKRRERLVGREQAEFAGRSGVYQGALARDRAGGI